MKHHITILFFVFIVFSVKGQKDFLNHQVINPAYAGSWETTGIVLSTIRQYVGIEGALNQQTVSFQSVLKSNKNGIGINIIHKKVGIETQIAAFANYSYKFLLSSNTFLRLGINAGGSNYHANLKNANLYPDGNVDPQFQTTINKFTPNVGLGAFIHSTKLYFGLSVPKFVNSKYEQEAGNIYTVGGIVINISDNLQFKPAFVTQTNSAVNLAYDVSANFQFYKRIWIGGYYKSINSTGGIVQWTGFKNFRIGYVVDYNLNDIRKFNYLTHELILSYAVNNLFPKFL